MNNQYSLSVIIPVYNMEQYLCRCVDSVLAGVLPNTQIILVDDGSKDNSPAMCDKYAAEHNNVQVIHQVNSGISATRNAGIDAAQGEYIFFLDSDDAVDEGIFRKFHDFIADKDCLPDIVVCNAVFVHAATGERTPMIIKADPEKLSYVSGEEAARQILQAQPDFEWHCWRYFYKREYLIRQNHRFWVGMYYEDVKWSSQVLVSAETVSYLSEVGVLYTFGRPGSIVNSASLKKATDKLVICQDCIDYTLENVKDRQAQELLITNVAELYISACRNYFYGLKEVYPKLKEYAHLLNYSKSRFGNFLRKNIRIFGFRLGSWITKISYKIIDARR